MNECKLLIEENISNNKKAIIVSNLELEMINKNNEIILLDTPNGKIINGTLSFEINEKLNLLISQNKLMNQHTISRS